MLANHEWKIVDFSGQERIRIFDNIPYPEAIFTLTIQRNSPIYKATVIIPAIGNQNIYMINSAGVLISFQWLY